MMSPAELLKNCFVVSRDDVNNAVHKLKDGNTFLSSENFINAPPYHHD
jgi:hypothetical protein